MKKADSHVKMMLADTILALCRNVIPFQANVSVEGLLGITMDDEEIFLVNINETIKREESNISPSKRKADTGAKDSVDDNSSHDEESEQGNSRRKKKRRRRSKDKNQSSESSDNDNAVGNYSDNEQGKYRNEQDQDFAQAASAEDTKDSDLGVSRLKEEIEEDDDEEIMFIKEEPSENRLYGHPAPSYSLQRTDDGGTGDPSINMSHLQQLAFQLSGDLSSSGSGPAMVSQSSPSTSMSSSQQFQPGGSTSGLYSGGYWSPRSQNQPQSRKTPVKERKFFCNACNKAFTSKYKLTRHYVTHTGEKPHKCELCQRSYTQSNDLKYHMKRVHPQIFHENMATWKMPLSFPDTEININIAESAASEAQDSLSADNPEHEEETHTEKSSSTYTMKSEN